MILHAHSHLELIDIAKIALMLAGAAWLLGWLLATAAF